MLLRYDDIILGKENDVVSLVDLFNEITGLYVQKDTSFGIYDDSYWCGTAYFYLYQKTNQPLPYILLKLPFDRLIDLYPVYHEMDYSTLYERYLEIEKEHTIIELLTELNKTFLSELSRALNISINTMKTYKKNDEHLYKASFDNVYKIGNYYNVPLRLFLKRDLH